VLPSLPLCERRSPNAQEMHKFGPINLSGKNSYFPFVLCDFILELKDLKFVHITNFYISNCDYFESLVDQVKAFVLPRRPNFKFYVSCCPKFPESRVPAEFDFKRI